MDAAKTGRAIFISYRRADAEGEAGRLYDDLVNAFGEDTVFMDVAGIAPGLDFRTAIESNVACCGVQLAIIGSQWDSVTNTSGNRRLEDPNDFVRIEIATALSRGIPVIPVLVRKARMPAVVNLPDNLKDLAYRNSVELTHARWNSDVALLINALKSYVNVSPQKQNETVHAMLPVQLPAPQTDVKASPSRTSKPLVFGGIAALLLAGVGAGGYYYAKHQDSGRSRPPIPVETSSTSSQPSGSQPHEARQNPAAPANPATSGQQSTNAPDRTSGSAQQQPGSTLTTPPAGQPSGNGKQRPGSVPTETTQNALAGSVAGASGFKKSPDDRTAAVGPNEAGLWQTFSPLSGTDSLSRFKVVLEKNGLIRVEAWGNCAGCDWGVVNASYIQGSIQTEEFHPGNTPEESQNKRSVALLLRQTGDRMIVDVTNTFRARDGRMTSNNGRNTFKRVSAFQ